MFHRPPDESPVTSWTWVAVWTTVIYCTIPFARILQSTIAESFGRQVFVWVVYGSLAIAFVLALHVLRSMPQARLWTCVPSLVAVGGVYVWWINELRLGAPEEALHFVEYGVLAILLFRAFSQGTRDWTVYVSAFFMGTLIGMVDEIIQWVVRDRYWDIRDIGLNAGSCMLMLIGIAVGIRPVIISEPVRQRSVERVWRFAMITLFLLTCCMMNVDVVLRTAREMIPGYSWLTQHTGAMTFYGYMHEAPDHTRFRSRMTQDELRAYDREHAAKSAAILDAYQDHDKYEEFLSLFGPQRHTFLHEARVHLYRRDRHRHSSQEVRGVDPYHYDRHMNIAYRENQIIEYAFGETLKASKYVLQPETLARAREHADLERGYVSPVSMALITWARPWQMATYLGGGMLTVCLVCGWWRHRISKDERVALRLEF